MVIAEYIVQGCGKLLGREEIDSKKWLDDNPR
jgi:hypothetical protein